MSRRSALGLGLGGAAAAGGVLSTGGTAMAGGALTGTGVRPVTPQQARQAVARVYQIETVKAGGTWYGYLSVTDPDGTPQPALAEKADTAVQAYSVNKIAVATALLDKVDRGLLSLDQQVTVTSDIVIAGGDGIFALDGAYPSAVTLGHVLAALLTVSDDTAVRLCGLLTTSAEINQIIAGKGFPNTQVEPVADPHRFYLGTTTPREMHDLLQGLVHATVLSAASSGFLLRLLRSPIAFTDGIRRTMSSDQRARIATKAGWFSDGRNEAGIIFDPSGVPVLTYSLYANGQADAGNFGATHPAVQARANMGPRLLSIVDSVTPAADPRRATVRMATAYRPSNGG